MKNFQPLILLIGLAALSSLLLVTPASAGYCYHDCSKCTSSAHCGGFPCTQVPLCREAPMPEEAHPDLELTLLMVSEEGVSCLDSEEPQPNVLELPQVLPEAPAAK